MRIISGTFKGRRISAPKNLPVRPTTDMAKEGLFNILNNHYYFDELKVIDLFAGTGNICYEFASRGTTDIIAVDSHTACVQFISKTSDFFEMGITVIKSDVLSYLEKTLQKADIIFADPPYALFETEFEKIIEVVFNNDLLLPNGMLIIEHAKKTDLSKYSNFSSMRKYGGSAFSFFKNEE